MVGLAKRLDKDRTVLPEIDAIESDYRYLLNDGQFDEAISRSTADTAFVKTRIEKSIEAFSRC